MVRRLERCNQILEEGSEVPGQMADQGSDGGLVVCNPVAHAVTETAGYRIGEQGKVNQPGIFAPSRSRRLW